MNIITPLIFAALGPVFGGKVYPQFAPDGAVAPFAIYSRTTSTPSSTLADGDDANNDHYQIDVYANTYEQCHLLSDAAALAMYTLGRSGNPQITVDLNLDIDVYESDVRLHRVIKDFSIWLTRSN